MFGYIIPDKPRLMIKDFTLYRALYCGICVATGKKYGQFARLTTNYDVTFLSALLHNFLDVDPVVKNSRCALHGIKKHPIAQPDAVTDAIVAANLMLVYYNLTDDILDEGGVKKRLARGRIRRAYKRVRRAYPELEKAVSGAYGELRQLEQSGCDSIDRLAEPFAVMMQRIAAFVAGDKCTEELSALAYHFGKWVYLIDAVDDLDKDDEKQQFNPFHAAFPAYVCREMFMDDFGDVVRFLLNTAIEGIQENYAKLKMHFNKDLTDNIVYRGIAERTKGVLSGEAPGKTPKI